MLAAYIPTLRADDYLWIGSNTGNFQDPNNWEDVTTQTFQVVPTASDTVDLDGAGVYFLSSGTVEAITGGTSLQFSSPFSTGTLQTAAPIFGDGPLTAGVCEGGANVGTGNLIVNNFAGTSLGVAGGTASIPNGISNFLNFNVSDSGTLTISGVANNLNGTINSGSKVSLANLQNTAGATTSTITVEDPGSTLSVTNTFEVDGGNLFATGGAQISAGADLTLLGGVIPGIGPATGGGSVSGAGTLVTASNNLIIGNGTSAGAGSFSWTVQNGAQVNARFADIGQNGPGISSLEITGSGSQLDLNPGGITVGDNGSGTLTIDAGGSVTVTSGQVAVGFGNGQAATGTIELSGSNSNFSGGALIQIGVAQQGSGTIEVDTGASWSVPATTELDVGYSGNGQLLIQSGASVTVSGSLPNLSGLSTFKTFDVGVTGTGAIVIAGSNSVLHTPALDTVLGAENGSSGLASLEGNGNWFFSGQVTVGGSGAGTLNVLSSTVTGTAADTFPQLVVAEAPNSSGAVTVSFGGKIELLDFGLLSVGEYGQGSLNVDNGGTVSATQIKVSSDPDGVGSVTIGGKTTGKDLVSCELLSIGPGNFANNRTGVVTVNESGELFVTNALELFSSGAKLILNRGRVTIGPSGALGSPGTVIVNTGGSLTGFGDVQCDLILKAGGTVNLGSQVGTFVVQGNFEQDAGGDSEIDIGGTSAGTFGEMNVTGTATLSGTLNVNFVNGFAPSPGETFTVLTAAAIHGRFSNVNGGSATYGRKGVTLTAGGSAGEGTLEVSVSPTNGGSVSRGFLGTTLRHIGTNYSITATPAKGYLFSGWSGGISSSNSTLKFTMPQTLTEVANFVPNPFDTATGAYSGSVSGSGASPGYFSMQLNQTGAFTALISLPGSRDTIKGTFNSSAQYSGTISAGGGAAPVTLQLDTQTNQVAGAIEIDGTTYNIDGELNAVFTSKNPAPQAGSYTAIFPAPADPSLPQGAGYASLKIKKNGSISISGQLGDGTRFTSSSRLRSDGTWVFYLPLYKGKNPGSIGGSLSFQTVPGVSDCSGTLQWNKPPQSSGAYYPGGFSTPVEMLVSSYQATPGVQVLTFTDTNSGMGTITLSGGNLQQNISHDITVSTKNVVTVTDPTSDDLEVRINPSMGSLAGSFIPPGETRAVKFDGVIYQRENIGAALFLGTSEAGSLILTPQ